MEPIARVELGQDAPAELVRLLPLVGLEPVFEATQPGSDSSSPTAAAPSAAPVALRVEFATNRADPAASPTTLTIARVGRDLKIDAATHAGNLTADFVSGSAIAAACFILSHALGLASPILTINERLFEVIRAAIAIARGPARVLVEGEIGVGKESLIKLIHAASGDPMGLIHAECAGLEADLVEAEIAPLLAQAAGATRLGVRPYGRTIFFNRIGELSPAAQGKLLDLIHASSAAAADRQDRQAQTDRGNPLAHREATARVRYLAASTRPLAAMVAQGEFLSELHELFDATLTIAPLRDRPGDLPMLVRYFLRMLNPALALNAAALRTLSRYPFPGNLRELINFVTRIAIVPARSATSHSGGGYETGIVGRAEVISQLDHASLKSLWRSRNQWAAGLRSTRRKLKIPALELTEREAAPAITALALVTPAAMRLTTAILPRQRNPRGGHKSPA